MFYVELRIVFTKLNMSSLLGILYVIIMLQNVANKMIDKRHRK